jgi:hypothetical protein
MGNGKILKVGLEHGDKKLNMKISIYRYICVGACMCVCVSLKVFYAF